MAFRIGSQHWCIRLDNDITIEAYFNSKNEVELKNIRRVKLLAV